MTDLGGKFDPEFVKRKNGIFDMFYSESRFKIPHTVLAMDLINKLMD